MSFIEFEQIELIFRKELFDTLVFSQDEFLIIGPKNYFNFKIKNLSLVSVGQNETVLQIKQGLGFISKKERISIQGVPRNFLQALELFQIKGYKKIEELKEANVQSQSFLIPADQVNFQNLSSRGSIKINQDISTNVNTPVIIDYE